MAWDWDIGQWFTPSKSDHQSGKEYNDAYNAGGLPDSLYRQLKELGAKIPGQVAEQKKLTAQKADQYRIEGRQGIEENVRSERGFGNTSLTDRLISELYSKIQANVNEANLNSDIWGTQKEADLLERAYKSLPKPAEPAAPSWQSNLMGGIGSIFGNWLGSGNNMNKMFSGIGSLFSGGQNKPYEGQYTSLASNPSDWEESGTAGQSGWAWNLK